jgi:class 3 adenylate cyclase/tetratricopeptide (TPR) repeat protein
MSVAARSSPRGTSLIPYVPRHVLEEILLGNVVDRWQPRRFEAVALFADMSGYTGMSEAFSPLGAAGAEELSDLMNHHLGAAVEIVERFGGSVGMFGGDSMSAIFPFDDRADPPGRAVACSLAIQAGMEHFRALRTRAGTFDLRCKVGLAVGDVLSAVASAPSGRLEWILVGEAVDASARAEHLARAGEVVCDDGLRARCDGLVVAEQRGGVSVIDRIDEPPDPAPYPALPVLRADAIEVIARFVDRSVADRISMGQRRFVNEHRRLAVVFAGFGEIDVSSERGATFLLDRASTALAAAERFDGHLHQIEAGDKGLLAVISFGAPVAHEDDEERALACALELARAADDVSIGIATGIVFCGERGGGGRLEYAATGDTMNVAARLMQLAEPGTIVCTDSLAPRSRALADLRPRPSVSVKGRDARVPIVEVRGLTRRAPRADAGFDVPMIGRDRERAELLEQLDRARRGEGTVVFISGEAGVGKSRLCSDVATAARSGGFEVHVTAGSAMDPAGPYLTWRPVARSLLGQEGEGAPDLRGVLEEIDVSLPGRAPLLGPVVGRTVTETTETRGLDAETRAELTTTLVTDIVSARARAKPLLLWFDDVQWMDAPSRDLFIAVARSIGRERVLLLGTFRTEMGSPSDLGWLSEVEPSVRMELDPLDGGAMSELLTESARRLFGLEGEHLRRLAPSFVDRAQGNPFYLEQLLNVCNERRIDPTDRLQVAAADLPEGLHRLALARLDALSQVEQMTLRVASVIGERFAEPWLAGSYPALGSPDAVRGRLHGLRLKGFIRPIDGSPSEDHVFAHGIVRQAAYTTLSDASRRELHEGVARYVEHAFGDDLGPHLGTLAHHYGATRIIPSQRRYFRLAADAAMDVFANETAIGFYGRLLPIVEGRDAVDVALRLGDVRQLVGGWVDAEGTFRSALELAEACGDERGVVRARSAIGYVLAHTGEIVEARDLLDAAVADAVRLSDVETIVTALEHLGFAAWQQGDYDASITASRRLVEVARAAGDLRAECRALDAIGLAYWRTGAFALARESFRDALEMADRVNDMKGAVHIANDFAGLLAEEGDVVGAFEQVRRGIEAARAIGYRNAEAVLIGNAGELYRQYGQFAESLECSLRCLAVTAPMQDRADVVTRLGNIALTLADEGRLGDADDFFAVTIAIAESIDDPYLVSAYGHYRAASLIRMDRTAEAEELNRRALAVATEIDAHEIVVRASVLNVRRGVARGDLTAAEAVDTLSALEGPDTAPGERAMLAYERWAVLPDEARSRAALDAVGEIVDAMPGPEHRGWFEALTGSLAPAPRRLPALEIGDLEPLSLDEALATGRSFRARSRISLVDP